MSAIGVLPPDISASVGYSEISNPFIVSLAVESAKKGEECESVKLEFRYYPTFREKGWSQTDDNLYRPGGLRAHSADLPVISCVANDFRQDIFIKDGWTRYVQQAILFELLIAGRVIYHDEVYYRYDGSKILDCQ